MPTLKQFFQKSKGKQLISPSPTSFRVEVKKKTSSFGSSLFSSPRFNLRYKYGILLLLVIMILVMIPLTASAQAGSSVSDIVQNPEVEKIMTGLFAVSSKIQEFLHSILWWVLLTIGALLQNDLLYRGPMEAKMLELWVYIRDVVNVFFVLILVGIALYNVVRGPDENFQIKAILPKFVMALIAVNFSFLGIKLMLDGVNIISTAIFALPNMVQQSLEFEGKSGKAFCEGLYGKGQVYFDNIEKDKKNALCTTDKKVNYDNPKVKEYFMTYNSRNAALAIALNLQKIDLLNKVYVPDNRQTTGTLALNSMFAVIFYIVYASAFVALMCVLLVRLVVLWVTIVLSPLLALMMVLPDNLKQYIGAGQDIGKDLIKHAIVPIPVAFVMSIGFIMFKTFENTTFADSTLSFATLNTSVMISGITTLQEFIAAIGTVAFIWKGVFDAMKDTYAGGIVEGIRGFVKESASTLAKVPTMIPFLPVGDGKKVSLAEMMRLPTAIRGKQEEIIQKGFNDNFSVFGGGSADAASKLSRVQGGLKNKDVHQALEDNYAHRTTPTGQKGLADYLKKNKNQIQQSELPKGVKNVDDFIKQLESGSAPDNMINEFYDHNDLIPKGTPAKTAQQTATGTPAQGSSEALANKYGIKDMAFNTLKNRPAYEDILKLNKDKALTQPERDKLDELSTALNSNNEEGVKKIMESSDKDLIKSALDKFQDVSKQQANFTNKVANVNGSQFSDSKEYFKELDKTFGEEYQNLTGETFDPQNFADPNKITPERKKALEIIQKDMAQLTQKQKETVAKAEGYKDSLTEKVLTPSQAQPAPGSVPKK